MSYRGLGLALAVLLVSAPLRAAQPPSVLFIFTDDQRADTIAALGNPVIKTPNLDRLCRMGLAFRRAYMQGGLQGATCVPSRAMLLSGQPLFRVDEKLMRDTTWPAAFAQSGYRTFISGKWHNGRPSLPLAFQHARSVFLGGMADPLSAKVVSLEDGKVTQPVSVTKHACAVFADEAVNFIRQARSTPYFCYVPFDGPHDPHIVPADFPVTYDPAKIPLPPNFLPQHPFDNGEMTIRDEVLLPHPRPEADVRQMLADYYRYISYLDMLIGRMLDAVAASPQAQNTIIVFSSDSGVARGSHGLIGKQNLYEHSLRVPLIVAGPGVAVNQQTDAMCYLFDVLPTLGAVCGVKPPPASQGLDFSAVLKNPQAPGRNQLVFGYRNVQRAIRDDRWKLIRYPQVGVTQLFDLKSDPYEQHDLAPRPDSAPRIGELMTRMGQELHSFGDDCPLAVENPKPATWSPKAKAAGAKESKSKGSK